MYNDFVRGLLPTKFYFPPAPGGFVARPQLWKRLDEVFDHHLTLVSAPAGAGKTTLVSAWVQSQRRKGMAFGWLSLDEADNDPGRFLDYLAGCLEEGGMVIDIPVLALAPGMNIQMEDTLADFIRGLMALKQDVILVLDDYHQIQNPQVHSAVQYLLDHASPRMHLILLTRSDPPLELARLRLEGQLGELRMEHLRFSAEEAAEFLKSTTGIILSEADVNALNTRAEGWIAGLQMAAISLRGSEEPSAFISAFTGSHRYVFDYLIEQVLNRQPADVRDFLLKTSIFERFSTPLCDAIMETHGEARRLLNIIERGNLFLVPLDDEHHWYRYHHLFSELLRLVLEQTNAGLPAALHHKACHWCEEHGLLAEALHHGLAAKDLELVAQIVLENVLALVENAEIIPVLDQIDSLPPEQRSVFPWLEMAHAWGLAYTGQNEKSARVISDIKNRMDTLSADQHPRMAGHIAAVQAYISWTNGQHQEAVAFAEQAERLLPENEIAIRVLNMTTLGNARIQIFDDPRSAVELENALALSKKIPQSHVFMQAASGLGYTYAVLGKFHKARVVVEEAIEVAETHQGRISRPLTASASVYAVLARMLLEAGEFEKALSYSRKAILLSDLWGQTDTIMICCIDHVYILTILNQLEKAQEMLQKARAVAAKGPPWHMDSVLNCEFEYYMDSDSHDLEKIRVALNAIRPNPSTPPSNIVRGLIRLDRTEEALGILDRELSATGKEPTYKHIRLLALKALVSYKILDSRNAMTTLEKALKLAAGEDMIFTFVREGPVMERLLLLAKAGSTEQRFIQRLLAAFGRLQQYKAGPPKVKESLIEPLSDRELEVLQHLNSYLSTPEIANLLVVSANTVRTHIKNIYAKLEVHGRSGAIKRAAELGLLA